MKERGFFKGIDLGGWMSQCDYSKDRLDNFVKEKDFEVIASWGLDHVRLPIDYNILENEDGSEYSEEGFGRVAAAVELAKKYGLKIILDLHKTAGFSFDSYSENEHGFFESEKYQQRFIRLWEEFAKRFGSMSDFVAFELLNEVTDKEFIDVWNRVVYECCERIRAYAPDTIILVGSYWNNSPEAVADLGKPYDNKIVYNFHCYDPLKFTHQGAYWAQHVINIDDRFKFEECDITPEYFEDRFLQAINKAESEGISVYCGEYGVINIVPPEETVKWFKVINAVFDKFEIGRAAWNYKEMDFGISDSRMDGVRDELLKYL